MWVQQSIPMRGTTVYAFYLVRESFRTPKEPRSRTLCIITGLPPEVREMIAEALRGRRGVLVEALG